jgi:hypothetical protein
MSWRGTAAVRRRKSIQNNGGTGLVLARRRGTVGYSTFNPAANDAALWVQPIKASAQRKQMFPGVARVFDARFSPDGHWIAYVSAQSGRAQVYLQAFPGPCERVQASTDGGREPVWAPNGSVFPHTHEVYGRGCEGTAGARGRQTAATV